MEALLNTVKSLEKVTRALFGNPQETPRTHSLSLIDTDFDHQAPQQQVETGKKSVIHTQSSRSTDRNSAIIENPNKNSMLNLWMTSRKRKRDEDKLTLLINTWTV